MPGAISPDILAQFAAQGWIPPQGQAAPPPPNPNAPVITPDLGAPPGGWPTGPATPPAPVQPSSDLSSLPPQQAAALAGTPIPAAVPFKGGHVAPPGRDMSLSPQQLAGPQTSYQGGTPSTGLGGGSLLPPVGAGGAGVKAGWVPTTQETETTGPKLTKDEREGLDSAQKKAAEGRSLEEQATVQANDVAAAAANVKEKQRALEEFQQQQEVERQAKAAHEALTEEAGKRAQAHAEYDLAVSKGVNPDRLWDSKDLGGKIGTGIGLVLNGLMPHHAFWTNYLKDRDADIQSQRAAIEAKGKNAEAADSHYALFVKQGMDANQAMASARVLADKQMNDRLDAAEKMANLPAMQKVQLQQLKIKNAQETQKDIAEEIKAAAPVVHTKTAQKYREAVAAGTGAPTRKAVEDLAEKLLLGGKADTVENAQKMAGNLLGWNPTGEAAPKPVMKGSGKSNPAGVSIAQAVAGISGKTHGEGFLERHTSDRFHTAAETRQESELAIAARIYAAAHKIPLKRGMSNAEVVHTVMGRPTPENVDAFVAKANADAGALANTATPGAGEASSPADEGGD